MNLCIDVGNSVINFGVFQKKKLELQFRFNSTTLVSSDQLGIFIKQILREHEIDSQEIKNVVICSVVPEYDYSVRASIIKYFKIMPIFLAGSDKIGLEIRYSNPEEIGADRIATAIGASELYHKQNIIVIDMGTATTICAITREREYLGGAILPGIKTSLSALEADDLLYISPNFQTKNYLQANT